MREFLLFQVPVLLFCSCILIFIVCKKPALFWPALIVVNLIGNGPRTYWYNFMDELFTISILLGGFLHLSFVKKGGVIKKFDLKRFDLPKIIFSCWVVYMVAESFVGIMANHDLRIIRWVIFYATLGLLFILLYRCDGETFPFPPLKQFILIVIFTTVVYHIVYLWEGVLYDSVLGQYGRYTVQYYYWPFVFSGTATAVFPTLLAMPAAILFLRNRSIKMRIIGWCAIALMLFIAFFYESRIALVIILGNFFVALLIYRKFWIKPAIIFIFVCLLMFSAIYRKGVEGPQGPMQKIGPYFKDLVIGSQLVWKPMRDTDKVRNIQVKAGFLRLIENPKTLLVGDGIYSHRYSIYKYMEELKKSDIVDSSCYKSYITERQLELRKQNEKEKIQRTTAFTGLLVDTGIIGMFLFLLIFLFAAIKIIQSKTPDKIILLYTIFVVFMWLFVNNISDVMMVYILIMPLGLLEQLNQAIVSNEDKSYGS